MLAAGDFSGFGFSDSINNHTINCHYLLHFDGGQLTHVILYKGLLSVVVVVFTTQDVVDETELQSTKPGHSIIIIINSLLFRSTTEGSS